MKTYKKLIVISNFLLFFSLLSGDLYSQYDTWGEKVELNFILKTWNSNSRALHYETASDNYGLHFVGLNNINNHLIYYLLDNNGQILEQYENSEYNYCGISIICSEGNVVIAAVTQSGIVIFKKRNGVSAGFVKIGVYSGGDYTFGSSYLRNMSSTEFNNQIYISWDYAGYYNYPNVGGLGLLLYDASNDYYEFLKPIDYHLYSNPAGGFSPKLTASSTKLHAVYRVTTDQQYILEPFKSRDMYIYNGVWTLADPISLGSWIRSDYYYDPETRADIICVGDKLYSVVHLFYNDGIDTRYKSKLINDLEWQDLKTIKIADFSIYKTPPLTYDQYTNRLIFAFSELQYPIFWGYNRELDIATNSLQNAYSVFSDDRLLGGSLSTSKHGNYLIFSQHESLGKYDISRRIRPISGNITYNTLLTGIEYVNTSNSTISHSNGAKIIAENGSTTTIAANSQLYIDQNDLLEFKSGSTLNILENAQLIIDGSYASLKFNPNVNINLGTNAKIIIRNGAYIDANGATFSGINGATWQGIDFDHSAGNNIRYCAFNNASTTLKFLCDPANETTSSNITDNTFNIPGAQTGSYTYGIYSQDMNYVGIGNNYFNMQQGNMSVGLCMKFTNSTSSSSSSAYYKILIYGNHFESGRIGMVLMSYASALKPYFIYNNFFNTTGSSIAEYGIATRKAIGEIKNCTFSPDNTNSDLTITQSSLSLTENTFGAIYNNINATASTVIGIAPGLTTSEIILTGGFNVFNSSSSDNIMMGAGQTLDINNGYNCFQLHGSGKLHLNGGLDISETTYDAYNNYWNTQAPDYYLLNNQDPTQNITLNYSQLASCQTLSLSIHQIIDRGNGLFDTIYKSQKPTNVYVAPDEALYNQAYTYLNNSVYPTAILNFKSLIDGYTTSSYLSGALYDLYSTYESLDTSSNQGYKDNLYSDFKTYLTEKINSKNYDDDFNDIAYNLILMCETNMGNYNDALTGYQFIAMYHPDAIARLMASWDYTEVEALFNGMGGSVKETVSEDKYIFDLTNKLEGAIAKDSTLKSLKNQYLKETDRKNAKISTVLNSNDITSKNKAIEQKEKDDLLIRKSVNVLMTSKNLSKEQKTQKQLDDIFLISSNKQQAKTDNIVTTPKEFNLSQNYPNPFNPTTKINYALPKTGLVTMKIYDVTGREIQTLVNDVKQAGNYTVDFNGANLSSGVYFYKIQSGDFISVKRMVLIK
ncbi:MAG: T9SS type A sorting domain-containing protein [Ignavibacteria bacterium]